MIRKSIATVLEFGTVALSLFTLLFADGIWRTSTNFLGSTIIEIITVFHDSPTQWMAVLGLASYFIVFSILERRFLPHRTKQWLKSPNFWLSALVTLALLRYAFAYHAASSSTQVSVLLFGIVFGKAISAWVHWQHDHVERCTMYYLVSLLICFLACTALWQPEIPRTFQYHEVLRWNGVWDNPNLYGLLMGVGVILSFGFLVLNFKSLEWRAVPIMIAIGLCGVGLFKSYSRGAWLGTICALAYLFWKSELISRNSRIKKNKLSLLVITLSLIVLGFWHFRFSEFRPAQRVFSAANANDFSWRNRVTAWEGALRMMRDRPFIGFGWGQAEPVYAKKYSTLDESAAIEMNDYFMLGISAGVPALICFLVYIRLCFRPRQPLPHLGPPPSLLERRGNIQTACRAGAIVLVVGFWFDGGLFKLPTATVFWMLVELSRIQSPATDEVTSLISKIGNQSETPNVVPCKKTWLRWGAGILAAMALLQTAVYLGTPILPISNRTLSFARKCLIPPKETGDFDFLSANPVWHNQKLKILLEHVDLAHYNRTLINWQLGDKIYWDYVLSPVIESPPSHLQPSTSLDWRRPLWETFYPRIRHETDPVSAAQIVAHLLQERIKVVPHPVEYIGIKTVWERGTTDAAGFEQIYIAALRSVGIPSRMDDQGQAELFADGKWQPAPR